MTDNVLELIDADGYKLNIRLGPVDKYMNKRPVVIETIVHDKYNNKWLEPRLTRVFLSDDDIHKLANWLLEQS